MDPISTQMITRKYVALPFHEILDFHRPIDDVQGFEYPQGVLGLRPYHFEMHRQWLRRINVMLLSDECVRHIGDDPCAFVLKTQPPSAVPQPVAKFIAESARNFQLPAGECVRAYHLTPQGILLVTPRQIWALPFDARVQEYLRWAVETWNQPLMLPISEDQKIELRRLLLASVSALPPGMARLLEQRMKIDAAMDDSKIQGKYWMLLDRLWFFDIPLIQAAAQNVLARNELANLAAHELAHAWNLRIGFRDLLAFARLRQYRFALTQWAFALHVLVQFPAVLVLQLALWMNPESDVFSWMLRYAKASLLWCYDKDPGVPDYLTFYARSNLLEDFAESFAYYVTHGDDFRSLAQTHIWARDLYDFFRDRVFTIDGEIYEYDNLARRASLSLRVLK